MLYVQSYAGQNVIRREYTIRAGFSVERAWQTNKNKSLAEWQTNTSDHSLF